MSPLIAIAATLFPEIIKAIAGDRAGTVADSVTRAVTNSVKTNNPVQAQQQLAQNPQIAEDLREKLAQIALEQTRIKLDDEQRQREAALGELGFARNLRAKHVKRSLIVAGLMGRTAAAPEIYRKI